MKDIPQGLQLTLKVIPKAGQTAFAGMEGDLPKFRLNAVPEKGRANTELISFLSKSLHIPKSAITILRGDTSRTKTLLIEGVTSAQFQKVFH